MAMNSEDEYVFSFVRDDGMTGTTKCSGWGAESLLDGFFDTLITQSRILYAVVIDDTGAVRRTYARD